MKERLNISIFGEQYGGKFSICVDIKIQYWNILVRFSSQKKKFFK